MQGPDRPIPTRVELLTPKGVDRQYAERQVRYFTKKRVRMDDPDFRIGTLEQGNPDQKRRDKLRNFYAALQRELLHHENWDGTPRTNGASAPCLGSRPAQRRRLLDAATEPSSGTWISAADA